MSYPRFSRCALLDVLTALLILAGGAACASTSAPVTSSPDITILPSESDTLNVTATCSKDGTIEDGTIQTNSTNETAIGRPIRFQIYLPPCYEQQSSLSYPVLYLLHGAGSIHTTWNNFGAAKIANRMIRDGDIPPFILVTPGYYAEDIASIEEIYFPLVNDLVPHIDSRYHTLADRRHRSVGGASLGGIVAVYMAFQYPEQFGSVGAFGAGIFEKEAGKFNDWIKVTPPEQRPRVLIDIGNQDTGMMEFTHVLTQTLTQQDVPYLLIIEPGQHNYQYWASHLERYYLWFAEDW